MRLLLLAAMGVCAALSARADDKGSGTANPFAEYQAALDRQLVGVLQRNDVPLGSATSNKESKAGPAASMIDFVQRATVSAGRSRTKGQGNLALSLQRLSPLRAAIEQMLESEGVPSGLLGPPGVRNCLDTKAREVLLSFANVG